MKEMGALCSASLESTRLAHTESTNMELTVLKNEGISLIGGRIAYSIKQHLKENRKLVGKELRNEYYRITRANAAATSAVQGEFEAQGMLKEITTIRSNKTGEVIGGSVRYFRPVTPKAKTESAKDKEIAELKAKLAAMEAKA